MITKLTYQCAYCKDKWVLISDKRITEEQQNRWMETILEEQNEVHRELNEKEVTK